MPNAAKRQGNVRELSRNFTLSGEWSPCIEHVGGIPLSLMHGGATPDLWLPSQLPGISALWPMLNYTAW